MVLDVGCLHSSGLVGVCSLGRTLFFSSHPHSEGELCCFFIFIILVCTSRSSATSKIVIHDFFMSNAIYFPVLFIESKMRQHTQCSGDLSLSSIR